MSEPNENSRFVCSFLDAENFALIHRKFVEGFSDYLVPFKLSERQFRSHIIVNAVDLNRSIGCFDEGELVGISLNGFGIWDGVPTIYDAGTAVIPSHRKRGVSESMFRTMFPILKSDGFEQCLLEVVSRNVPALRLYEKLGFERTRTVYLMQATELKAGNVIPHGIEFRDVDSPDMSHLSSFGDGKPTWQNSNEAVERSLSGKRVVGAFDSGECVGYVVFSEGVGRVSQIAVRPGHRRRGIARSLLAEMKATMRPGFDPQVINIDAGLPDAVQFFRSCGFEVILEQFEMRKSL